MLGVSSRSVVVACRRMKAEMARLDPMNWTMWPVLDHLSSRLETGHFFLLKDLAEVLSGDQQASILHRHSVWRTARPGRVDSSLHNDDSAF